MSSSSHTPTTPGASSILASLAGSGAMVPQTPNHLGNSQAERLTRTGADETPIASTSAAAPPPGLARPSTEPAPVTDSACCPAAAGRAPSAKSEISYDCSGCPVPALGTSESDQHQENTAVGALTPAGASTEPTPLPTSGVHELPLEQQQPPGRISAPAIPGQGINMPESAGTCQRPAVPPDLPPTPPSSSSGSTVAEAEPAAQQQRRQEQRPPPPPPQQQQQQRQPLPTQSGEGAPLAESPDAPQRTVAPAATGISFLSPPAAELAPLGGTTPGPTTSLCGRSSPASAPGPAPAMCAPPTTPAVATSSTGAIAGPLDNRAMTAAGTTGGAPSRPSLNILPPELLLRVMQASSRAAAAEQCAAAAAARAEGRHLLAFQAEVGDVAPGFTATSPAAALRSHCLGVAGASRALRAAVQQLLRHPKDAAAVLHARDGPAASAAVVFGWPELRRSLLGEVVPRAQPDPVTPAAGAGPGPMPGSGTASRGGDTPDVQAQAQLLAAEPSSSCIGVSPPPPPLQLQQQLQQEGDVGSGASKDGSSVSCAALSGGSGPPWPRPTHTAHLGCSHHSPPHAAEGVLAAAPPPLPHPLQLRSKDTPATAAATQSAAGATAPPAEPSAPPAEPSPISGIGVSVSSALGNKRSRRAASHNSECAGLEVEVEAWAEAAAGKLLALAAELAALQGVPVWAQVAGLALAAKEARIDCLRQAGQQRKQQQQQQSDGQQACSSARRPRQRQPNPEADALLALSRHLASHPLAAPAPVAAAATAGRAAPSSAAASPTGTWPRYTAHLMDAAAVGDVRLLQALLGPPLTRLAFELPAPPRRGPKAAAEAAAAAGLLRPDGPQAALLKPRRPLGARPWLPVAQQVLVVTLGAAVYERRLEAAALLVLQYGAPPDVRLEEDPTMAAAARGRRRSPVELLGRALVAAGTGHEGCVKPALTWRRLQEAVEGSSPEWTELYLAAGVWRRHKLALPAVPAQRLLDRHWSGCPAAVSDVVAAVAAGRAADGLAEALAEARAEEEALLGRDEARDMLLRVAASGRAQSGATARVLLRYLWPNLQCAQALGAALGAAVHASAVSALAEATPRSALHSLATLAMGAAGAGGGAALPAAALQRSRLLVQVLLSAREHDREELEGAAGEHAHGGAVATAAATAATASRRRQWRLLDSLPGELADVLVEAVVAAVRGGRVEAVRVLLLQEQESPVPLPLSQEAFTRCFKAATECPRAPAAAAELAQLLVRAAVATTASQAPHRHQPLQIAELLRTALTAAAERLRTDVASALITAAAAHLPDAGSSSAGDAGVDSAAAARVVRVAREMVSPTVLLALQAGAADALATIIAATVAPAAAAASGQGAGGQQAAAGLRSEQCCYGGMIAAALSELDAAPGPAWWPAAGEAALALLALPPPSMGQHAPAAASASVCMPPSAAGSGIISERLARRLTGSSALFALQTAARAGGGGALGPATCCRHCISQQHKLYQCPHCCWYTPDGQAVVPAAQAATDRTVWGIMSAGAAQEAQAGAEQRVRTRAAAVQTLLAVGRARSVRWQSLQVQVQASDEAAPASADGSDGGSEHARSSGSGCEGEGEFVSQPLLDRLLLQVSLRAINSCSSSGHDCCGPAGGTSGSAPRGHCAGCRYLQCHHDYQQPLSEASAHALLSVLAGGRAPAGDFSSSGAQQRAVEAPAAGGMRASLTAVAAAAELVCSETAKLIAGQTGCCVVLAPSHVLASQQAAGASGDGSSAVASSQQPSGVCSAPNAPPRPLPHPLSPRLRAAVRAASVQQRRRRLVAVLTALLPPPQALMTTAAQCSSTPHGTAANHQPAAKARPRHQHQQVGPYVPGGSGCLLPTGALDDAVVAAVATGSVEAVEVLLAAAHLSPRGLCRVLRAVGQLANITGTAAAAGRGGGVGDGVAAGAGGPPAAPTNASAMLAAVRRRYDVPQAVLDWLLGEAAAAAAATASDTALGAVWLWRRAGASPWPWLLAGLGGRTQPRANRSQQGDKEAKDGAAEQQPAQELAASRVLAARLALDAVARPLMWPRAQALRAGARLAQEAGAWRTAVREGGAALLEAWREQHWGWL